MNQLLDPSEVQIKFQCDKCSNIEECNVVEAVCNGAPICSNCNCENEMTIVYCFKKLIQ